MKGAGGEIGANSQNMFSNPRPVSHKSTQPLKLFWIPLISIKALLPNDNHFGEQYWQIDHPQTASHGRDSLEWSILVDDAFR
jgi:hypothetical protein